METYIEIRWHGRAQQGIVTAAKLLAEACLSSGKYAQAFPEFGPERMGAPVRSYNRISEEPIRLHCQVTNPKYVLIADPTLIGISISRGTESSGGVTEGAADDAVFIVNTPRSSLEIRAELRLESRSSAMVYTLDAARISIETIGRSMPNTPIQAVKIAENEKVRLPVMVCLDGFITSHAIENVSLMDDAEAREFIGEYQTAHTKGGGG